MYSISQFAKLAQVSTKLLRHYDDIGLLQPAQVNPETGYRYYQLDQLARLNRIIALKNLGLSLREVARLLDEEISADELRGMLRFKQAQLRQVIEEEQGKLREVETRLRFLEAADHPPIFDIAVKSIPAQRVVSLRRPILLGAEIQSLFQEIQSLVKPRKFSAAIGLYYLDDPQEACGAPPAFTLSNGRQVSERELPGSGPADAEAALVIAAEPKQISPPVTLRDLPAIETAASVIYQGPYTYRHHAYWAFTHWSAGNGYRVKGAVREVYLRFKGYSNHPDNLLEIQIPLER